MSIQNAVKKFGENVHLLTPRIRVTPQPLNDVLLWNLNSGLVELAKGLHDDIAHLEHRINTLEASLHKK